MIELIREVQALKRRLERVETDEPGAKWKYPTAPLTSTSYDGNDTVAVGTYTIDTSTTFGVPAGIKACIVLLSGQWASASSSNNAQIRFTGGSLAYGLIRAQVANMQFDTQITVPCDSNGDFDLVVGGANMSNALLRIVGYVV